MRTTTLRSVAVAAGFVALATLGAVGTAQAQNVAWSVGINSPGVSLGVTNAVVAPGYYRHAYPRYYAAPRAVYYTQPAPVYYNQPAPVYYNEPVYADPYVQTVVYPASYYVGWRQGYVRYNNRWVHPSYVRGYAHGNGHGNDHWHR